MDGFVDTDIDLAALAAQITQGDQDVATGDLQADLAESPVLADAPGEAALLARVHETLESAWLAQGDGYSAENFNMEAALGDRAFLDWAQAFLTQSPAGAQHPVTSTPAPGSPAPDAASPDTTPTTNTKLLFTDPPPDDEVISDGTIITVPGGGDLSDFGSTGSIANTQYDGDAPSADALPGDDDTDEVIVRGVRHTSSDYHIFILRGINGGYSYHFNGESFDNEGDWLNRIWEELRQIVDDETPIVGDSLGNLSILGLVEINLFETLPVSVRHAIINFFLDGTLPETGH